MNRFGSARKPLNAISKLSNSSRCKAASLLKQPSANPFFVFDTPPDLDLMCVCWWLTSSGKLSAVPAVTRQTKCQW